METFSCVAHAHWCFHSNSVMTVKSRQHFRASTNRASHQPFNRDTTDNKTIKSVAVLRTQRFKHRDVQQMKQNNCVKRGERRQESTADQQPKTEKYTEMTAKLPTDGSLLKGQYTFSSTQCVQVTRVTMNKIEKIGINKS